MQEQTFTICVLFYGNYPQLAQRLCDSLRQLDAVVGIKFRFGLNNVSPSTMRIVRNFYETHDVLFYYGASPYYKYPLMRKMLQKPTPVTKYTMWFDDDSYIMPLGCTGAEWGRYVVNNMQGVAHQLDDVLGSVWRMPLRGKQRAFIQDQPWYNNKPITDPVHFVTGGWWCTRTEILVKHDWPPANFDHNGGDVMFGALCEQHGYRIKNFTYRLGINTKDSKCSDMPRRGFSQTPIGVRYKKKQPQKLFDILDGDCDTTKNS